MLYCGFIPQFHTHFVLTSGFVLMSLPDSTGGHTTCMHGVKKAKLEAC